MNPKAASDLTNVLRLFENMLDDFAPLAEGNAKGTLLLFHNSCDFKDALKSILGIKQNDRRFEQIEHSGSNSG
jgi:hypothetical protein